VVVQGGVQKGSRPARACDRDGRRGRAPSSHRRRGSGRASSHRCAPGPRGRVFVAPNHPAGGPVQPGQPGHAVAGKHPVNGGGLHAEQKPDARRPPAAGHPDLDDPAFQAGGRAPRTAVRPAGAIPQARRALLALAAGPASGRGRRDLEPLRCPSQRSTRLYDAARQFQPVPRGQQSMSVGHEGFRAEERFLDSSTPHSEVFLMSTGRRHQRPWSGLPRVVSGHRCM
jgi:hypothetical protein